MLPNSLIGPSCYPALAVPSSILRQQPSKTHYYGSGPLAKRMHYPEFALPSARAQPKLHQLMSNRADVPFLLLITCTLNLRQDFLSRARLNLATISVLQSMVSYITSTCGGGPRRVSNTLHCRLVEAYGRETHRLHRAGIANGFRPVAGVWISREILVD